MSALLHAPLGQSQAPSRDHGGGDRDQARGGAGNAARQDELRAGGAKGGGARGPFRQPWLDGMLSSAFGQDLGGLSARFGQRKENRAIGADAHTEESDMSFAGAAPQAGDLDGLEVAAHEVAHALASGGSGQTALDTEGDPGERGAETAGRDFRAWAATGFEGPVPRLRPAAGGRAQVHRSSSGSATVTGSPMLRHGSSGSLVSALQQLLNGFGHGLVVDGIFGDKTDNAVRAYQRSNGLDVDGIVGPSTASALTSGQGASSGGSSGGSSGESSGGDYAVTGSPMLRTGSTGALVSALQGLLNGKGASLGVDGVFGSMTDAAVRNFQGANGLEVDGIVGPNTASALNSGSSNDLSSSGGGGSSFAGTEGYDDLRDAVLDAAASHLGAPYYWGADGPSMFDCSGFVLYVLRQDTGLVSWGDDTAHGIKNRVPSTTNPQKGDLNFYSSGGSVQHVEIYTGSGSTEIGASGGGSSTHGNDPNAKVQYGNMNADSRTRTHGSIADLLASKQA